MAYTPEILFLLVFAYLMGSIPFGLILAKTARLGDIRQIGSGNIGATNVLRTGNKGIAATTLILDVVKGIIPVLLAKSQMPQLAEMQYYCGALAVLGHMFPVWLKFQGGKGVATTIGVILACNWMVGLAVIATWLVVFALLKISSLAAMESLALAPLYGYFIEGAPLGLLLLALAIIVIARHKENIQRLISGKEHTFTGGKNS